MSRVARATALFFSFFEKLEIWIRRGNKCWQIIQCVGPNNLPTGRWSPPAGRAASIHTWRGHSPFPGTKRHALGAFSTHDFHCCLTSTHFTNEKTQAQRVDFVTHERGPKAEEVPVSVLRASVCFVLLFLPNLPLPHFKGKPSLREVK